MILPKRRSKSSLRKCSSEKLLMKRGELTKRGSRMVSLRMELSLRKLKRSKLRYRRRQKLMRSKHELRR